MRKTAVLFIAVLLIIGVFPMPSHADEYAEPEPYTIDWVKKYIPASCMSFKMQTGDPGHVALDGYPPTDTYRLIVDYHNQCVRAYEKDINGEYTVLVRMMICTTGGGGNWTPTGTYYLGENKVRFGHFSVGGFAQFWTQIKDKFYFHSLLYKERNDKHVTMTSYNLLGNPGSHGCVRLYVPDALWIYVNCAPGTECIVTTDIPEDVLLRACLKKGYKAALDYLSPEEMKLICYFNRPGNTVTEWSCK